MKCCNAYNMGYTVYVYTVGAIWRAFAPIYYLLYSLADVATPLICTQST